ncbi:MAG: hypothetical protein BMS9Abin37_0060 [Acidobacteriota bacterium]|nr:MAG: hypothetical protein BMS9Abin37_0060 [Acidobacteriota bacterium]
MLTIRDKQTMSDKEQTSEEEPFLLTILPFAGLGLLLVLAVLWRVIPGRTGEPDGPASVSPEEMAAAALARWDQAPTRDIPIEAGRDYILGPEDARVTLVEFSDFECPFCRNAANSVHDVMEKFDGDVRLVFKNFPLDISCNQQMREPMHRLACQAATLAWCAGRQDEGLFWAIHDAIFREPQLTADTLDRIPNDIGVNREELDACMAAPASTAAVKEDITLGRRLGVTGTPVFFANGRKVSDYRRAALEAVVEHILSEN